LAAILRIAATTFVMPSGIPLEFLVHAIEHVLSLIVSLLKHQYSNSNSYISMVMIYY